jgi:hypothetical protein
VPVAIAASLLTFIILQILHRVVVGTGADFRAVLRGATDIARGHNVYSPAIAFLDNGHLRDILHLSVTPYVYPPPLALALRPLTLFSMSHALMIWDCVNVVMQGLLFVMVVRVSKARTLKQFLLICAMYGFYPLNMGLGNGQIDLLITVAGLAAFLFYRSGKLRRAGFVLGIVILIKPTIAVLLLYFALRKAWQSVCMCVATVAAGIGISGLFVGIPILWEYRTVAAGWANAFGVLPLNQSLHGVIARLVSPARDLAPTGIGATIALAAEVMLPLAACAIVWRMMRAGEPDNLLVGALQFYAVFAVMLLSSPFTENIHFTWILPGAGLVFVAMSRDRRWRPRHAFAVGAYLVLALPFAEYFAWQANTSIAGRLTSGIECYGLAVLALVLCNAGFGRMSGFRGSTYLVNARKRFAASFASARGN